MEPVEHGEGVRIVMIVAVVRFWAVSKANAKEEFVARAENLVPVVEMVIVLLVVLALLFLPVLLVSPAHWKLAQVLELLLAL